MNYLLISFLLAFVGFTFANSCNDDNAVFKTCGTACPRTCANPSKHIICIEVCREGCFCKDPYVKNQYTGKCVLESECPKKVTETCAGPHEQHKECGTACPMTCANMNQEGRACIDMCVKGCFCEEGYVRNSTGTCVLKRDCPQVYAGGVCAGPHEKYNPCGTACPKTCANMNQHMNCIAVCRSGCFCEEGYVRDSTGTCLLKKDCPQTFAGEMCSAQEEYKTCGTACPTTCRNYKSPHRPFCIDVCKQGCFCKAPYVRDESTGKCVLTSQCKE